LLRFLEIISSYLQALVSLEDLSNLTTQPLRGDELVLQFPSSPSERLGIRGPCNQGSALFRTSPITQSHSQGGISLSEFITTLILCEQNVSALEDQVFSSLSSAIYYSISFVGNQPFLLSILTTDNQVMVFAERSSDGGSTVMVDNTLLQLNAQGSIADPSVTPISAGGVGGIQIL